MSNLKSLVFIFLQRTALAARERFGCWKNAYIVRRPLIWVLVAYVIFLKIWADPKNSPHLKEPHLSFYNGSNIALTGIVDRFPELRSRGLALILEVETLEKSRHRQSTNGLVYIDVGHTLSLRISPGDRIRLRGHLQSPLPARIPGTFDVKNWLATKNIYSIIYSGPSFIENLGDSHQRPLLRAGWNAHRYVLRCFETTLSRNSSTVISGLTIGNRPRRNEHIKKIFTETGSMHVLVASGSNIAFVATFTILITRLLLRMPYLLSLLMAIPAIWGYALTVGLDAPIVRSALMSTLVSLYILSKKNDSPTYLWCLAALILLGFDHRALFDVGFLMSFSTVFGLLHWRKLCDLLQGLHWSIKTPLILLGASLTAQIWIFPITATIFKTFFPMSPLFNILITPLAGIGLFLGAALVISSGVPLLMTWVAWPVELYLRGFIFLIEKMAIISVGPVWTKPFNWTQTFCWYLSCFLIPYLQRSKKVRVLLLISCAVGGLNWAYDLWEDRRAQQPSITWIDVGRSLSVLIKQRNNTLVQINPPDETQQQRIVLPYCATETMSITSSTTVNKNEIGIFNVGGYIFVLGNSLSLKHQRMVLDQNIDRIDILQTRFSPKTKWNTEFLERYKPRWLIDTGFGNKTSSVCSPWEDAHPLSPQTTGILTINLPPQKKVD